ncbi:BRO-N domain-containing protein [Pantoea stewartii]|uniref:BRO-N domain-containing protein n=1 Tax=Pantoea stewartii TaxID=66269 RepID=UPI0016277E60|nr:BRO family protein [Pantoea stewartii]MBC0852588.1 antirepressor protein [Pantoea stewartii]
MAKKNRPKQQAANQHIADADSKPASNETPAIAISISRGICSKYPSISCTSQADADEITVIRFEGCSVRVVSIAGEPWFVSKDVCAALGITDHKVAVRRLNDAEKGECLIPSPGGKQRMLLVAESGFYKLIARSRKATIEGTAAYRFSEWVFREVIPSIRKNGAYGVPFTLLNDFSRRKAAYAKKASRRGHALQACRSEKERLAAEEAELWRSHQPQLAGVNDA